MYDNKVWPSKANTYDNRWASNKDKWRIAIENSWRIISAENKNMNSEREKQYSKEFSARETQYLIDDTINPEIANKYKQYAKYFNKHEERLIEVIKLTQNSKNFDTTDMTHTKFGIKEWGYIDDWNQFKEVIKKKGTTIEEVEEYKDYLGYEITYFLNKDITAKQANPIRRASIKAGDYKHFFKEETEQLINKGVTEEEIISYDRKYFEKSGIFYFLLNDAPASYVKPFGILNKEYPEVANFSPEDIVGFRNNKETSFEKIETKVIKDYITLKQK